MVVGSRSPWFYFAIAAVAIFFTTLFSFSSPSEHLANIKSATLNKVCDTPAPAVTITKTVEVPVATDASGAVIPAPITNNHYVGKTNYKLSDKPPVKVVALVFSGRRATMKILDCFLRRNLAVNGGWLDEVRFEIKTDDPEDIAFVDGIVKEVPEYTGRKMGNFGDAYTDLDRSTIYVKIDDDVVFFEDHTIPAIVTRVYENKQYSLVSANVMNQPALAFVHYHLGAIHPYLPETTKPKGWSETPSLSDWRPSKMPNWQGDTTADIPTDFEFPPYKNHRWLRMENEADVSYTPVNGLTNDGVEYNPFSIAWKSWAIAAQEHYSFLENLEKQELWRYKFDIWNYHYERLSINFIAFEGALLIDNPIPDGDDERYLTVDLPKLLGRPAVLDGSGLAVHYGFFTQGDKLRDTDLLPRYNLFAQEHVCSKPWGTSMII